uniref:arachidonate 5-lipoxygenase isoform X1 n=1 Tax=Ciona intestinalis TaxID=7719 RepID=UPI000180C1B3|nr:arachidonate 5-lipoxygenase isoform X1 [Ciona intestinalis]|eukprot:XP_018669787.2 arachidonate 5-lipoxygenase isoform X1 [Ciona intestinalis]
MEEYVLNIKTSNRFLTAGTLCGVHVRITGRNGTTSDWTQVDTAASYLRTVKRGSTVQHVLRHDGEDLGPPIVVGLKLSTMAIDIWYCDEITIEYENKNYEFPVYDWVEADELSVTSGEGKLPQNETSDVIKRLRKHEVTSNIGKFQWCVPTSNDLSWGMPRHINAETFVDLPRTFSRNYDKLRSIGTSGLTVAYNATANLLRGLFWNLNTLDDYRRLYTHLGNSDPCFIDDWTQDEEFGRQVLTGVSPLVVKRCVTLPEYCNVTDSDVIKELPTDCSLDEEIKGGRIFIVDLTYTKNVERNVDSKTGEPFVCADCLALFRVNDAGKFVPIAIQLTPDDPESIFTPSDKYYDWLLAKIYFRATLQSSHEWHYHFLNTHGVSETFSVATLRCFPRCHPVFKLLQPHLKTVPNINTDARVLVIPPKSLVNKSNHLSGSSFIRECFKTFDISQLDIPSMIRKNGTDDCGDLPNYHYRDDAIKIWNVIQDYVSDVIRYYYWSDKDIVNDYELQGWAHDVAVEGFGWQDGNTRGAPENIVSVEQLVWYCTLIIFTSSAQHSAVNFGQRETYKFIPNAPGCMVLPVHKRGEGSLERIMSSLPGIRVSSLIISFAYSLSEFTQNEIYLGDFPERLFSEEEVLEFQFLFKRKLDKLATELKRRNQDLKYPYIDLMPGRIPISISI